MPPHTFSPDRADDSEVSSRRVPPDQKEAPDTLKTRPEGDTSATKGPDCADLTGTNNKGSGKSGAEPETVLESSRPIPPPGVSSPTAAPNNP